MSRPVKIFALIMVVLLVGAAVTGIAIWTAGQDTETVEPGLYQKGKRVDDPGVMLTIGEYSVSFEDYRHYYLMLEYTFKMYYGDTIFEDDPDGDKAYVLKKSVEEELVSMYAWLKIAEENDITLSDEEKAEVQTTLAEQKETHGDEFGAYLEEMFFDSEEQYVRITELQKLQQKAQTDYTEKLTGENEASIGAEADAEYKASMISAKHILISFDEEETDVAKAEADALAEAEALLVQIRESEDPAATFDELMWEHTDDMDGLEANPDGYTFGEGEMVDEFYQGAKALAEGEISEPIKSTYGYHIILRMPLSAETMEENRSTAVSTAVTEMSDEKLTEVKETLPVTGGQYYDSISPGDIA